MADTFQLQIATPERLLVDEQVTEAELPGKEGYMGVLAGHAPLLSALGAGSLSYRGRDSGEQFLVVDGGFVEIFDNQVRVLADNAEYARDLHAGAERFDLEEAKNALKNSHDAGTSEAALRRVQRAQARLDALDRIGAGRR